MITMILSQQLLITHTPAKIPTTQYINLITKPQRHFGVVGWELRRSWVALISYEEAALTDFGLPVPSASHIFPDLAAASVA